MMYMEETSDTLTLASEERAKQGIHELEISFGGELDLHKHFHKCEKNPRHLKFIPVNIFKEHHLPKHRHSHKIAAWIRQISHLTVKLSVNYVSPNRPPEYPLSDRAGQRVLSVGSGFVTDISLTENNDKLPCPLKNCGHRPGHHEVCGYITIVTAAHVVFDDEEAQNTTVEFFYDDSSDRSGVMRASGVRVAASSVEGDFCELLCVTHERKLFERLKYKLRRMEANSDTLTLSAQERAKQLIQEIKITIDENLDLQKHFDNYSRNPGHPNLIPVKKLLKEFKLWYLHKITGYLMKRSYLNVSVYVNYVSPNRPSGYPLSDRAGQRVLPVGSGFVTDISHTENYDKLPCPLKNCGHGPGYHEVCGYITIVTAAHVVFDDEEAKNTTVEFFYDDSSDRSGVMIASGVRVAASSVEGDFCELLCVTHETKLFERFKRQLMYAMEKTSNKPTLAAEKRAKQLIQELEISIGGKRDLHKQFDNYSRNPGHPNLIPVNKVLKGFNLWHLHKITAYVMKRSYLNVNVYVNYVSPNRPSGYPLSDRAGQRVLPVGSGFVADINNDKLPCPLKNCGHGPGYHEVYGYITIVTAAHVVFDDEEAKNTTVEFFFDNSSDRRAVMIVSGVRVAASSEEGNFCALLCVTHERKLFERFKRKLMCAMEETSDTLTLSAEERGKQRIHELEISLGGEADLHKHFDNSSKNSGIPDSIPVSKLEEWHFLKHCHSLKITDYAEKISDLTVKLSVNYVSPNRPSGYPLSDRAGQRVLPVGSGFVTDINNDKLPCPLKNCGHGPGYHEVCGYITIVTAAHVVFDDEEAKNTTVEFFYTYSDRRAVMIASGVRVAACSVEGDFCELLCVTHETQLFERFKRQLMYVMEETSDTLTLSAEERGKLLIQEIEISLGRELDLHKHFDNYSKNPGHPVLIPVNKLLDEWHFLKRWYSHKITDYVGKISDFTVKLIVKYVSSYRPSRYPLSDRAGHIVGRVGGGFVTDISLTENNDKLPCPLKNCDHLPGYHVVSGYITIVTAPHVVFDDEEAKNTTVEFQYDSLFGGYDVMKASGVRVAASSVEGDFCKLLCVTHERKLFEALKKEFISRVKKEEVCQLFRTLLPGLESIQYAPGTGSHFLAKIRLSNPTEAAEALIVLKAFTEDVIDRALTYWNPSNNSLSDVLDNTSFSKEDMLALIKFEECIAEVIHRDKPEECIAEVIHRDKPAPYYVSGLRNLYSRICGNNNIKTSLNCQEAILSLISELGKHYSTLHSLETALSLWNSSQCDFLNIHNIMDISNGIATIKVTLFREHIKYASRDSESNPDDMFLVHIAHPHGQSKHVTIGRQTDCFTGDGFYHQLYTAPTCPGCSGGPVWMNLASGDLSEVYGVPHSGCHGNQLNKGCSWTIYPLKTTYYDYERERGEGVGHETSRWDPKRGWFRRLSNQQAVQPFKFVLRKPIKPTEFCSF